MTDLRYTIDPNPTSYSARVDSSGRIVVPAELRERLHFRPGDELVLQEDAGVLHVRSYEQVIAEAQAYFADVAPDEGLLSEELIRSRREEARREALKNEPENG